MEKRRVRKEKWNKDAGETRGLWEIKWKGQWAAHLVLKNTWVLQPMLREVISCCSPSTKSYKYKKPRIFARNFFPNRRGIGSPLRFKLFKTEVGHFHHIQGCYTVFCWFVWHCFEDTVFTYIIPSQWIDKIKRKWGYCPKIEMMQKERDKPK